MSGIAVASRVGIVSLLITCVASWATPGPLADAAVVTIVADPADTEIFGAAGVGSPPGGGTLGDMGVGDTGGGENLGRRSVVRFDIRGLTPASVTSAILRLNVEESRKDQFPAPGIIDGSPPFTNPGLGDTRVIHIGDSPVPTAADYNSPSLGNDPGVLIAAGVDAPAIPSVDATQAVKQALSLGQGFVAFRIQTAVETDGDGLNDVWFFYSANYRSSALRPRLDVDTTGALADPRLIVDLNTATVSTGQTLIVTFRLTPGVPPRPVDAYVVVQLPDSRIFSLTGSGTAVPGLAPIARGFVPVTLSGEGLRYTVTGTEPTGAYRLIVGLTEAGTLTPASPVEFQTIFLNH